MSTADVVDFDVVDFADAKNVGKVDVDDNDDNDDQLTDTSCLEVPMMDYYKIRHQV
jgi:hypothetical protein